MVDDKTESRNGRLHGQDMLGWDWGTGYIWAQETGYVCGHGIC